MSAVFVQDPCHLYSRIITLILSEPSCLDDLCVSACHLCKHDIVLRVLRSHDLPGQSPRDVFWATVIGKIMYCATAWHGFCLPSDYSRLNSCLRRCINLVTPAGTQRLSLKCSKMLTMRGESYRLPGNLDLHVDFPFNM